MGPVKDTDILKSVKENNRTKFLKQLSPEKNFMVSKFGVKEDSSVPGGRIRLKLTHVNINCHEDKTGYTPLIISVLNGNKDIIEDILFHSADPNAQDSKGNTALHMAVFGSKIELVDLLIQNKAKVNIQNSDGNTPLHIACQSGDSDCRVHIMLKLLSNGADVELPNRDGNIALDVAAMFNKTEAVSVLLDNDHDERNSSSKTRTNTSAMIEAAIRGNKDVVELLLDYGYDANVIDEIRDTVALIEAVRFVRLPVAESLLKYGAKSDVKNIKGESPESLVAALPKPMADKFTQMFEALPETIRRIEGLFQSPEHLHWCQHMLLTIYSEEDRKMLCGMQRMLKCREARLQRKANFAKFASQKEYKKSGATQTPRFLKLLQRGASLQAMKEYPVLPNDVSWTHNTDEFCNSCTPNAPNTNILTDDLCKCWIAAEVHHAWTVLDLKYNHTLTGLTIYGWDSPQMVRGFELQRGSSLQGPWSTVFSNTCIRSGNTNLSEPGTPQTFTDFTATSRYWRLELLDNHGGKCICFQGLKLYGCDERIRVLLAENHMEKHAEDIILLGYNFYKKFLLLNDTVLQEVVSSKEDREVILKSLERDRPKEFHPASLSWTITPVQGCKEGEVIPDFSVKSSPGVKTKVKLVSSPGLPIHGETEVYLQSDSLTDPSTATFTGISFGAGGKHKLKVQCVEFERVCVETPQPIDIKAKAVLRESVAMAFDDMEAMLKDLSASLGPISE